MPELRRGLREHGLVLTAYGFLSYVFVYPALTHPFTHIPGKGDAPWFLWDLWWFKHALVDLGRSPYFTDLLFHPHGRVPITGETPLNELGSIPLQLLLGDVVPVYNLLFFASFVLSGWFTYLLLRPQVERRALAFLGGMLFAFCGYRAARALGHLSLLTTQWMPFTLLMAAAWWKRPGATRALGLGVSAAAVALSNPYYLPYFLGPVALAGGLWVWGYGREEARDRRRRLGALLSLATCALLTLPAYAHYLDFSPQMQSSLGSVAPEVEALSADLLSYVLPSGEHPLWGALTAPIYARFASPNLVETTLFVGFLPALLVGLSFLQPPPGRAVRFWQMLAVIAFLGSLGPTLHLGGHSLWSWMPYDGLLAIPGFDAFRAPSRIGVTTSLAVAVIATRMADRIVAGWAPGRVHAALALWGLALLVNLPFRWPFLQADARIPAVHRRIAEAPGDFAVLELPAGPYHLAEMSWHMQRQSAHRRPLVSGYINRGSEDLRQVERETPFLKRFFTGDATLPVRGLDPAETLAGHWPLDLLDAHTVLATLGVGRVILHRDGDPWRSWLPASQLLFRGLGMPDDGDDDTLVWDVTEPPSGPPELRVASVEWTEGAGRAVWLHHRVTRGIPSRASVILRIPIDGEWCIRGELTGSFPADFRLTVNGEALPPRRLELAEGPSYFESCGPLGAGPHDLTLAGGPFEVRDLHVTR